MASSEVKAWTFTTPGYPSCLSQNKIAAPSQPNDQQFLVKVRAAALNPVDIQIMNIPLFNLPFPPFNKQKPVASDFSGTVIAAGKDTGFKEGDEVFGVSMWAGWNATMTEVALIDMNKACVCKKPSTWTWEQAAAITVVFLTARTMIEHVASYVEKSTQGKKLVVLGGSSATGMYVVRLAEQRGWNIMATCSGRNVDFVKSMGAKEVTDYTQTNVAESVKAFKPDAIVDCVGGTECVHLAKRYITIVGDKTTRITLGGAMTYLWNPQMVVRWAMGRLGLWETEYACLNIELKKHWLEECLNLPLDKIVIDSTYSFDQVKEAYERLNTGRARGKVVVQVEP